MRGPKPPRPGKKPGNIPPKPGGTFILHLANSVDWSHYASAQRAGGIYVLTCPSVRLRRFFRHDN